MDEQLGAGAEQGLRQPRLTIDLRARARRAPEEVGHLARPLGMAVEELAEGREAPLGAPQVGVVEAQVEAREEEALIERR